MAWTQGLMNVRQASYTELCIPQPKNHVFTFEAGKKIVLWLGELGSCHVTQNFITNQNHHESKVIGKNSKAEVAQRAST